MTPSNTSLLLIASILITCGTPEQNENACDIYVSNAEIVMELADIKS